MSFLSVRLRLTFFSLISLCPLFGQADEVTAFATSTALTVLGNGPILPPKPALLPPRI